MGPLELNLIRQEKAAARQQAQENTQLQQVDSTIVEQNIPEELKLKGKTKVGQSILNLGKKTIKIILPKLTSLAQEYAIGEFEIAKAAATTPEQIDTLKQQFCPAPDQLQRLIDTRNNIVGQLNSIGTKLDTLNSNINDQKDITNNLKTLLSIVNTAKLVISAGARVVPVIPGVIPALLNDLETIDDLILFNDTGGPRLEKNLSSINAASIPVAIVTSIINKIVNSLSQLDGLIKLCSSSDISDVGTSGTSDTSGSGTSGTSGPNSTLDSLSDIIVQIANNQTLSDAQAQLDASSRSYKGFSFQIEEVPFSPTVNRLKAIALNQGGIPLLETPLSFTINRQTLIDELKLIIDRDNLKPF
jgi:hypothetical protein